MELTREQQRAVETIDHNLQLIACAGSGKTEVITRRIAYILKKKPDVRPEHIVAFTFTNKAGNSMKERIQKVLEQDGLTAGGADTVVPLSTLKDQMVRRQVPSAQFPLIKGRLPSYTDVSPRDWFSVWVDLAYNLNLMQGVGDGRFAPHQTLTVAEALKLAAFLESQANGDTFHLQPVTGTPWYKSSVTYCEASGIISAGEFTDLERPVTRAEMAYIFSRTSLARNLPEINSLSRVKAAVPDVRTGDYAAAAIFGLYAKGILTGSDGDLTFRPKDSLTRAEAAAIVSRMARAEQRITLW